MRSLILHTNRFATNILEKSNWPKGIISQEIDSDSECMKDCLVVFFCVEEGDDEKQVEAVYNEVSKTAREVKVGKLMISPFVHLSKNIAKPKIAKRLYEQLMNRFKNSDFDVQSSCFGYHKRLFLDVKGYPGSFRYREFY